MRIQTVSRAKIHRRSFISVAAVVLLCAAVVLSMTGCTGMLIDNLVVNTKEMIRTNTDSHIDGGGGVSESDLSGVVDAIVAEMNERYQSELENVTKTEEQLAKNKQNLAAIMAATMTDGKKLSDADAEYLAKLAVALVGKSNTFIDMALVEIASHLSEAGKQYSADDAFIRANALTASVLSCGDEALAILKASEMEELINSVSKTIAEGVSGGKLKDSKAEDLADIISFEASNTGIKFIPTDGTYDKYLMDIADREGVDLYTELPKPNETITINAADYTAAEMENLEKLENYEGRDGNALLTDGQGYVEYKITVPQTGFYNIILDYFTIKDHTANITRDLYIDGEAPFEEAMSMEFNRVWRDSTPVSQSTDSRDAGVQGNEIRSEQVEVNTWREQACRDATGYYDENFVFWFTEGEHTLKLVSQKEQTVLKSIIITNPETAPSYDQYKKLHADAKPGSGTVKIQAENSYVKSNLSIYPTHDRTSPITENSQVVDLDDAKFDYSHTKLNVLGGDKWKFMGQWISWQVKVETTGFYKIIIRGRQNINTGMTSSRRLMIDGKVPFEECEALPFVYSDTFKMETLGGDEAYEFYLKAGETHTITLQNVLGQNSEIARRAQASVKALNTAYRRILVLTGTSPDVNRDYHIDKVLPDVITTFAQQAIEVRNLAQLHFNMTGARDSNYAMLERVALRLQVMANRHYEIPENFGSFKADIGSIGSYILALQLQPYEMDYILVAKPDQEAPKANAGFFKSISHEVQLFFSSFVNDYSMVGGGSDDDDSAGEITVWYGASGSGAANMATGTGGREQAQIIKQIIDDSFVPETNIKTNLQFISMSALLPATLAGKGPDVALQIGGPEPMNYAMRKAVVDLSKFPDFNEVKDRFYESAMVQYSYNGGVYALPEIQTFNVMFYRKDIMSELGLEIPENWDQIKKMLPELLKNNMNFGYPVNSAATRLQSYITLLYQRGGDVYKNDYMQSNLDSEVAINTFIYWTQLYLTYKMPYEYNYENRIRTGEMPIVVADNAQYNVLTISAPEIRGLWGFTNAPGSDIDGDGVLNKQEKTITTSGSGCMMLSKSKDKDSAWEFMKWWTSSDIQSRFAIEVESTLGSAARYPSANREVLANQAWTADEYKVLISSLENTKGVPEVPGGYYTARHIDNAFNRVVISKSLTTTSFLKLTKSVQQIFDARETLLDFVRIMNEELYQKRTEYGLPAVDPSEKSK